MNAVVISSYCILESNAVFLQDYLTLFHFSASLCVLCLLPDVNKGTKKKRKQQQTPSSATVMDLVSTKRQGVTKQVKLLQGRQGHGKSKATVKNKRIKSAVGPSPRSPAPAPALHCLDQNL